MVIALSKVGVDVSAINSPAADPRTIQGEDLYILKGQKAFLKISSDILPGPTCYISKGTPKKAYHSRIR